LSEPPGLSGHLRLVFSATPGRGTFLAQQSACAPMHLGKTYWDGETLLVNVVNQTAGIFGGDRIVTNVVAGPGTRVLLSSPSAARLHPSRDREARLEQAYEVRAGARLDVFPELTIPQRGSRCFQQTRIEIERGGECLYLETLAPGRVASGEVFAFESYAWQTDVLLDGQLILRERADIRPGERGTTALRALFPASYHASLLVISPDAEQWDDKFRHGAASLSNDTAFVAASRLSTGGWTLRILAADSIALRRAIHALRGMVYARLGTSAPDPRRTGGVFTAASHR
jgi:urease accessory protein